MIRWRSVLHILGVFLVLLAAAMLCPLLYGLATGSAGLAYLLGGVGASLLAGFGLWAGCRSPRIDLNLREGILLTVLVWIAVSLFGGLPFYWSPYFSGLTDAFFEAASGFTTTGATVLTKVEVLPPALQLWRHLTHWVGGMGVVLLGIAVLPLVSTGGMVLYRAEFSGARSEKLKPRVTETALALWRIYAALTLVEYVLLRLAGMLPFDAVCHSFSTMATGGFSTRTDSVGAFDNPAIEYIIVIFMIAAGMNFAWQYRLWREGRVRDFFRDYEVRGYLFLLGIGTLTVLVNLLYHHSLPFLDALRLSLFQVVSIGTTTGFVSANYETWAPASHTVLLAFMFIGGCTGSTAGGWKIARVLLLARLVGRELKRIASRRAVFSIHIGGQAVPEATIQSLLNLVYLSLFVFLGGMLLLSSCGVDLLTSISAVSAAMFSIGPGFGTVGPSENYAHLPVVAKWTLSACMIAGRLEFFTAVVVLTPSFWRR